jgi:hypothetical protein
VTHTIAVMHMRAAIASAAVKPDGVSTVVAGPKAENPAAQKKQGATGITTVAPYVAGQWGRGNNRLPG